MVEEEGGHMGASTVVDGNRGDREPRRSGAPEQGGDTRVPEEVEDLASRQEAARRAAAARAGGVRRELDDMTTGAGGTGARGDPGTTDDPQRRRREALGALLEVRGELTEDMVRSYLDTEGLSDERVSSLLEELRRARELLDMAPDNPDLRKAIVDSMASRLEKKGDPTTAEEAEEDDESESREGRLSKFWSSKIGKGALDVALTALTGFPLRWILTSKNSLVKWGLRPLAIAVLAFAIINMVGPALLTAYFMGGKNQQQ